jgi:hypothetical protein
LRQPNPTRVLRLIPLAVGAAAFVMGLWVGLARLGLSLPGGWPRLAEFHGALMTGGFLGTLICLERAVALGRWWAYAAPAFSACAAVALMAGFFGLSNVLFLAAGVLLTVNSAAVIARQAAMFTVVLGIGSVCWAVGTFEWLLGASARQSSTWWLAFLVLTIAAERLEMSRLVSTTLSRQAVFSAALLLIIVGALRDELAKGEGWLTGLGLLASTLWLARHDIATRTVRLAGQPRFTATCLLAGYVWLGAAGILFLSAPLRVSPFWYDAVVHAIAIGFVISMIFGHAPIILPAVARVKVTFRPAAYLPLSLLHLSVLLRMFADITGAAEPRTISGPLTVLAIALYAVVFFSPNRQFGRKTF